MAHRGSKAVASAVLASFKNSLLDSADPHTNFHNAELLHRAQATTRSAQNPRLLKPIKSMSSPCSHHWALVWKVFTGCKLTYVMLGLLPWCCSTAWHYDRRGSLH